MFQNSNYIPTASVIINKICHTGRIYQILQKSLTDGMLIYTFQFFVCNIRCVKNLRNCPVIRT